MGLPKGFNDGWKDKIKPQAPDPGPKGHHCILCDDGFAYGLLVLVILMGFVPALVALLTPVSK